MLYLIKSGEYIIGAKATLVKDYFVCTETKVGGKKGYRLESRIFNFTM